MDPRYPLEYDPSPSDRSEAWLQYAEVYLDAIKELLSWLKDRQLGYHDYQILPLLFLFRHYLELQLKGLIVQTGAKFRHKDHNLRELLNIIKPHDDKRYLTKSPKLISQLSVLDEKSDVFRYPEDTKGKRYFQNKKNPIYEQLIRLASLEQIIIITTKELENLEGYFDAVKDSQNEETNSLF